MNALTEQAGTIGEDPNWSDQYCKQHSLVDFGSASPGELVQEPCSAIYIQGTGGIMLSGFSPDTKSIAFVQVVEGDRVRPLNQTIVWNIAKPTNDFFAEGTWAQLRPPRIVLTAAAPIDGSPVSSHTAPGLPDVRRRLTEVILARLGSHRIGGTVRRLLSYGSLPTDWRGHGSRAVVPSTVTRAIQVLVLLDFLLDSLGIHPMPTPMVGPTEEGSIIVEWDSPVMYLMVRVTPDNEPLGVYVERPNGEIEKEVSDTRALVHLVHEVAG